MNEEVMPASSFRQSYIPYALRLAFGMPSREDMDGIYAYYFNRLLQRAERVDLLFNSSSEGVRTGEMSRYLYQLFYSRGIEIRRPGVEVMAREHVPVVVKHAPEIDLKLKGFTAETEGGKFLSPSAINAYIDCSLKFYLRYIARIGEREEVEEEISAAGFGTVVHETIRVLYGEIVAEAKGMIGKDDLEQLKKSEKVEQVLTRTFSEHHYRGRSNAIPEGRNIIILKVMLRYLRKIIETDLKVAPFELVSAEQTYVRVLEISGGNESMLIRIGGLIDRVDRIGDVLRVIDYKTGDARTGFSGVDALFDYSLPSRNRAALQTLLYSWLVRAEHPGSQVTPGLYVMKSLYDKEFDPRLVMGSFSAKEVVDSFAKLEEPYLLLLKHTLERMFNPAIDFKQTDHEEICRYCDFSRICSRQTIE
jgi:CRISPR/Cas system-associated exonuclease Cas4 (RecB family)